jgi:hypothetical protein
MMATFSTASAKTRHSGRFPSSWIFDPTAGSLPAQGVPGMERRLAAILAADVVGYHMHGATNK